MTLVEAVNVLEQVADMAQKAGLLARKDSVVVDQALTVLEILKVEVDLPEVKEEGPAQKSKK
jgi:hypothetical protein